MGCLVFVQGCAQPGARLRVERVRWGIGEYPRGLAADRKQRIRKQVAGEDKSVFGPQDLEGAQRAQSDQR